MDSFCPAIYSTYLVGWDNPLQTRLNMSGWPNSSESIISIPVYMRADGNRRKSSFGKLVEKVGWGKSWICHIFYMYPVGLDNPSRSCRHVWNVRLTRFIHHQYPNIPKCLQVVTEENPVFACWEKKLDGDEECAVDKCPIGAMSALPMDCLRSIEHVSSSKTEGKTKY